MWSAQPLVSNLSQYLLNPQHPQVKQLKVVRQVEMSLDPRLVRSFYAES